ARVGFSDRVRQRIDTDVLEHDHRGVPLDNAEEDVVIGPLKRDVEPEPVAIERQRGGDIFDDEERRNGGNGWFGQWSSFEWWMTAERIHASACFGGSRSAHARRIHA